MDFSYEAILALLSTYGLRLLGAIVIFYLGRKVANWLSQLVVKAMQK